MATTRACRIMGLFFTLTLFLVPTSLTQAQGYVIYPGGAYSGPYYLSYPGPIYPPIQPTAVQQTAQIVRTSATPSSTYAASSQDQPSRPGYYSEDYSGPDSPANEPSKVAYIRVRVPANAELWLNGEVRKQVGNVREFVTPTLDPERVYVYNVRARWTEEGGINVEKTLRIRAISGTRVTVNFVRPPAETPRPVVQTVTRPPTPAPRVPQQPVDWTFGSAPRSFNAPRP